MMNHRHAPASHRRRQYHHHRALILACLAAWALGALAVSRARGMEGTSPELSQDAASADSAPVQPPMYRNPILPDIGPADPCVIRVEGKYYLYPTWDGRGYDVLVSDDLIRWERKPKCFVDPRGGAWAPDVFHDRRGGGKFYLYFTVNNPEGGKLVGVAEADGPLGPFQDPQTLETNAIDAHLFQDDDGALYLYYVKMDGGFRIMAQRMSDPRTGQGDAVMVIQPTEPWERRRGAVTEGPWMLKHQGLYYLMYSGSGADGPEYGIGYATSPSPMGPFTKYAGNPIAQQGDGVFGPGHHCVVEGPDGGLWMVYHQQESARVGWRRFLAIDPLWFDDQGVLHTHVTRGVDRPLSHAARWTPAAGPLVTRWAKEVTPDNAWREYPRPQLVRPDWINLNGLWQYAIAPRSAEQPSSWDGHILVPFAVESALSGVKRPVRPDQRLWYRRSFTAPAIRDDQQLWLHFGAVDWQSTIWVNGRQVGEHTGGYDPFSIDITAAVRPGANDLVVAVWDPTDTGYQPKGKQVLKPGGIMYTAVTGIWQTVWLETVPRDHIAALRIVPDIDRSLVAVTVDAPPGFGVTITASDGDRACGSARGASGQPVEVTIPDARLWSPDTPHLYDLQIDLTKDDQLVDRVASYCGLRKIEVRKDAQGINRLMLNNQVLFQYGPLDQGWWPDGLYTPATDEAIRYDIEMTKQFGMNMARKHVKYECARWYYWCDRLGLLVWQDMPSGDAGRNAESKANYRSELKAMIDALRSHPCIVMWVPFNEGWGQHDTAEVVRWIEDYDPTRPVNEASGWTDRGSGTVSDMHSYPGPAMRPVEEQRVVVLGEFGGLGMPLSGHTWQAEDNWGYVSFQNAEQLTDKYVELLTQMRPLIAQGLSAAVYTQTTDVEIEVNGLMTYDREVNKIDLERAADAARKLYLPPPRFETLLPTSERQPQTWKYTVQQPGDGWFEPGFADDAWASGPGGFGTPGTPGAVVATRWDTPEIWIRRAFTLDAVPAQGELSLAIHHDEDAEVYLNGRLVKSLNGYTTSYSVVPLGPDAIRTLQVGENTLAVHCRQTRGGQYIDAGLTLVIEASP